MVQSHLFPALAPRVAGTGYYQPPGKLVSKHSQSEHAAELSHGCPPAALSARILGKVISGADSKIYVQLLVQRTQLNMMFLQDSESFQIHYSDRQSQIYYQSGSLKSLRRTVCGAMCVRRVKKLRTPGFSVKVIDHQLQNTKHLTAPLLQISQLHKLSAKVEGRSFA